MNESDESHAPSQSTPRALARTIATCCVWLIGLALFLWFFAPVSTVILGVLAATIVAVTLHPLLKWIPGPRGVAAGVLGLALITCAGALVLTLSWPLARPIRQEIKNWPQIQQHVNDLLQRWTADLKLNEPLSVQNVLSTVGNFLAGEGGRNLFSRSADFSLGILLWLVFIFVGSIFLLTEPPDRLLRPMVLLLPIHRRDAMRRMLEDLGPRLRRWVIGTLLSMTIVFVASLIGYLSIGLDFAVPLATLAGLCEIVPTVGPATAAVIATIFAAATSSGQGPVIGVLCVYAIIQSIEAYVILPMIMRGAVKMHPAVTLFTVVLWGKIFGVPGLMLAIPINLTLWSLAQTFIIAPARAAPRPIHEPLEV